MTLEMLWNIFIFGAALLAGATAGCGIVYGMIIGCCEMVDWVIGKLFDRHGN